MLLTVTPAAKAAVDEYCRLHQSFAEGGTEDVEAKVQELSKLEVGSAIDHNDLIHVSGYLLQTSRKHDGDTGQRSWRVDALLQGASVYRPPAPPKPEPTSEYKALMKRLRADEEQRQYERMVNPLPAQESFKQRFPNTAYTFDPATSIGQSATADEVDEVTYADVNRQMALIINVLVSIIACSVAIWIAARRWDVPQRLGLSMSGSGLVAVAEVAIYMGYIRRIKEAKVTERKTVETKEIVQTWVLDGGASNNKASASDGVKYRKGKHR